MTTHRRKKSRLFDRLALAGFISLAMAGLVMTATATAQPPEEQKILVKLMGDGEGETIDISSLAEGETRFFTTGSGAEVEVTRTGNGYAMKLDGKEININTGGAGGSEMDVFVLGEGGDGPHGMHTVQVSSGDGEGPVWVNAGAMTGQGMGGVVISGLGDLEDFDKQRIIDAIRDAGIEKEIHFAPSGGAGFHFITADGEGGANIIKKHIQVGGAGGNADAKERIMIIETRKADGEDQD